MMALSTNMTSTMMLMKNLKMKKMVEMVDTDSNDIKFYS